MKYADAVRDTWCHHDLGNARTDYRALVRYATLAASSHNTQPWRFRCEPGRIVIAPDRSRRCPAVDPDDHHLYASLGCATENLLLAARAAGLAGHYTYRVADDCIQVDLEPTTPARSALFEAIPARQCTRTEYDGSPLTAEALRSLGDAGRGDGVSAIMLTGDAQKAEVARYVAEGNRVQFGDAAWARELQSWIRFNAREAVRSGDGLYGPAMGSPDVPRWLGKLFMRFGFSAERQNRKDVRDIERSSAVAVLFSEADDRRHWIEAGRCYQRLALQAAALDLRTAFINQPVEVAELRPRFARSLGLGDRRPDLVVRVGRGPAMPRSLRRPLDEVLT